MNENVMDRVETLNYLSDKFERNEQIVVSRYNDGEYLLMNKMSGHVAQDADDKTARLLNDAIKVKGQLVCINYLKPHNMQKKDIWFRTQQYLTLIAQQDLYGCGNWILYDFCNENILFPKLFSGKVLVVAGLADEASDILKPIQSGIGFYKTPMKNAVESYDIIKNHLQDRWQNYETILFACGTVGKVLIADFIKAGHKRNMIDIGSMLNAVIDLTDKWPMSWAKDIDLKEKREDFYNKLGI